MSDPEYVSQAAPEPEAPIVVRVFLVWVDMTLTPSCNSVSNGFGRTTRKAFDA